MAFPDIVPEQAPAVDIPKAESTCLISIIDTTCILIVPSATLVEPAIPGHELMNFPTVAFLITNSASGRQAIFDLGCQKDFWNLPPPISEVINEKVPGIKVEKNLVEVLEEGGFDTSNLETAIISHHHYDHIGDPSTFPKSMSLLVGPGFSEAFLPGYPKCTASPLYEHVFQGREIRELDFTGSMIVAGYAAIDYFNDGSFYVLNTPGHAIGHLSGLLRTTSDTFVFLGADICHFGGSFRPTKYVPMPQTLSPHEVGQDYQQKEPYNCSVFTSCHPSRDDCRTSPYYTPCSRSDSWYANPLQARDSIETLKVLDADENILVLIAHDPSILGVVNFFPNGTANDWKKSGWKEKLRWRFLDELPVDRKPTKYLVDGMYKNGERIKDLAGQRVK